jgi:hypothetical protein
MSFTDTPVEPDGSKSAGAGAWWRPRFVLAIRPGLSAFTLMPSLARRFAASTANRTFAVFDWL